MWEAAGGAPFWKGAEMSEDSPPYGKRARKDSSVDGVDLVARYVARRIGANVREARRRSGMSAATLGELAGLSAEEVSDFEEGHAPLTAEALLVLSRALGLPSSEFLK